MSSFVHHFKAIIEFQLELQSGNTQFGPNFFFFSSRVTIKFDGRPWKTIGHLFYTTPSLEHYFKAIGDFKLELQSRNIQFGSKLISLAVWPWNLTDDLEKQQGTSRLCIILSPYVNSNGSNSLETAKLGFDLCDFDL